MPRQQRSFEPGLPYHLISRFVGKEWFIRTDEERARYLRLLGDHLDESDWRCFTYAIMSNHIHLGAVAGRTPLSSVLRTAHTLFADWINRDRGRIGAVFTRGPKAIRVYPDGVARLIGYIHNNPVRAGIVEDARDCSWTSHRAYLRLAPVPEWLDVDLGIRLSGFRDAAGLVDWIRDMSSRDELAVAHLEPAPRRGRPKRAKGSNPVSVSDQSGFGW